MSCDTCAEAWSSQVLWKNDLKCVSYHTVHSLHSSVKLKHPEIPVKCKISTAQLANSRESPQIFNFQCLTKKIASLRIQNDASTLQTLVPQLGAVALPVQRRREVLDNLLP